MNNEVATRTYDLERRLIAFAVRVMHLVEALPKTRVGNHIAGQLVRCGTSPAHNYGEALAAESRADFIHKLGVCLKELRETRVCLLMIQDLQLMKPARKIIPLLQECNELIAIFTASRQTARLKSGKCPSVVKP